MRLNAYDYITTQVDTSQPLVDNSTTGRAQPWREHRANGELLAWAYDDINSSKAARLRNCAPRLTYGITPDGQKLRNAWFCRVRLCPLCQWRRSLKIYGQAAQIIQAANAATPGGYGWVMLTLTVRNVDALDIANEITLLGEAWHRLIKLKQWQQAVIGAMRSLEITHNLTPGTGAYDTYHPHLHCLLCVHKSYFTGRNYLSQRAWCDMWRKAAKLDYAPQVNVQRVKGDASAKALAEVAKYSSKPGDYIIPDDLDMMAQSVAVLDKALHRRRLIAWTGLLKQIHTQLGLDDAEDGDLINTADKAQDATDTEPLITYDWVAAHRQYYREV